MMTEGGDPVTTPERLDLRLEGGAVEVEEVVAIARLLATHLDAEHAAGRTDGNIAPMRIALSIGAPPRLLERALDPEDLKAYTAPEAWTAAATASSDQFSMAAVLYEALCGGRAFPGDDEGKIQESITTGRRVPLAARVPGLAEAVDAVFERGLATEPDRRFPSCSAFADALVQAIDDSRDAAKGVLVQKPSGARTSSLRPLLDIRPDPWDDDEPRPIEWTKVIIVLAVLILFGAVLALMSGR
jgi:serine/threonine-protein kinase